MLFPIFVAGMFSYTVAEAKSLC